MEATHRLRSAGAAGNDIDHELPRHEACDHGPALTLQMMIDSPAPQPGYGREGEWEA